MINKEERINELKELIIKTKKEVNYYNSIQTSFKLAMNQSYGCMTNAHYLMYNPNVGGSITAHGRDLIQYMEIAVNEYFKNIWNTDTELHEKLGISILNPISATAAIAVYMDTDSCFVALKPALDSCDWKGDHLDFVHKVNSYRLENFFKEKLEIYAAKFNVKNIQDFEMERIDESAIFLAKKKYIQHVRWEDKIYYDKLKYIYPKGVELIRSSTPSFVRERMIDLVNYIFMHPADFNIKDLLKLVKNLRREFEIEGINNMDQVTTQSSCSNYKDKVVDDVKELKCVDGAHYAVKAAAYHNFLLNNNKEFQDKYPFIKSGDKIKMYYCKSEINGVFAYLRGSFPYEFAPEIDWDTQFEVSLLSPLNGIITPLGLPEINKRLSVIVDLFSGVTYGMTPSNSKFDGLSDWEF